MIQSCFEAKILCNTRTNYSTTHCVEFRGLSVRCFRQERILWGVRPKDKTARIPRGIILRLEIFRGKVLQVFSKSVVQYGKKINCGISSD